MDDSVLNVMIRQQILLCKGKTKWVFSSKSYNSTKYLKVDSRHIWYLAD